MLSSIHPFGERSRNNNFALTVGVHVLGSAVGGTSLGLIVGGAGWLSTLFWDSSNAGRAIALGGVAAILVFVESAGRERLLPTRTRQVNENWIQQYRGWVYAGGFGVELGFGVSTIITTTLVHVLALAMLLVGSIPGAVAMGVVFGVVRGATVLTTYRVDSPARLRSFHLTLDRLRNRSRVGGVAALGVVSVIGLSAVVL